MFQATSFESRRSSLTVIRRSSPLSTRDESSFLRQPGDLPWETHGFAYRPRDRVALFEELRLSPRFM